jgi:hypothetical protein
VGLGHSNGWRSQNDLNRFKISNGLKTFKFFQNLIDPNLTFPRSKKLKQKYGFEDLQKDEQLSPY